MKNLKNITKSNEKGPCVGAGQAEPFPRAPGNPNDGSISEPIFGKVNNNSEIEPIFGKVNDGSGLVKSIMTNLVIISLAQEIEDNKDLARQLGSATVKALNRLLNEDLNYGQPLTPGSGGSIDQGTIGARGGYTIRDVVEVVVIDWLTNADRVTIDEYYDQVAEYWD